MSALHKRSPVSKEIFPENFEVSKSMQVHFLAEGCSHCYYTGYQRRKAIYEIIPITKELVLSIKNNELEIGSYLEGKRIASLKSNAVKLMKDGTTSVEEVYALLTD